MNEKREPSPTPGSVAAILPAAGSGTRFGGERNKLFASLGGVPLWFHAASRLSRRAEVGRLIMAVSPTDRPDFEGRFAELIEQLHVEIVLGGAERTDSVRAALATVAGDDAIGLVAIHDAARPLVTEADLDAVFAAAARTGAAILATPLTSTVKRELVQGQSCQTVDRRDLFVALTPQVFEVGLLNSAYAKHNGRPATDDAQLVERIGHDVVLVHGSPDNLKVTYPEDLLVAEAILARQSNHA